MRFESITSLSFGAKERYSLVRKSSGSWISDSFAVSVSLEELPDHLMVRKCLSRSTVLRPPSYRNRAPADMYMDIHYSKSTLATACWWWIPS